jgi:hypothetical protein
MPNSLDIVQAPAVAVWGRFHYEGPHKEKPFHTAGIKFVDLSQHSKSLIQNYTLEMLCDDEIVRKQGILQLMNDIRNLDPELRLKAYRILTKKEKCTSPESTLG